MIKKLLFVLISFSIATVLIAFTPSCNGDKKEEVPIMGNSKILAVVMDSGVIVPSIIIRQINKTVKYDSVLKKDVIVIDTLFGLEKQYPMLDSLRQQKKDSSGKPLFQIVPVLLKKDSVNTHIENIPLDILLDKTKWKQQN